MRKKLILILLLCLLGLGLAAGSAVLWASRYMHTPQFRDELGLLIQEATGREASLQGQLTISVFPWFGLKAEGFSLGNDPRFGETPLLRSQSVSARIKVLPLLQRRLVFDIVELDGAELVLTMDPAGLGNWEGLAEHLRQQENASERTDSFFRKITVRGVRVLAGAARLDDQQHRHSYIATNIDLRTGRIESGKPLPFTATCDFDWPRPGLSAHVEGSGKLHWSAEDPAPLFTETLVKGEIGGTFMPKSAPKAAISASLSLEDEGRHLKLSDAKLRLIGTDVTGEVTFFDVTEMFRLEAKLNLGRFSPRDVLNAYWPGTIAHDHQSSLHTAQGPLNLFANVDELVFETPGFTLDASVLKGRVRMGFEEVSGLDFDLAANALDADGCIAAFSSNATSTPLVVADLPLEYLRQVKGAGRIQADSLKLAGVSGQGAEVLWQGGAGLHKAQLKPLKAQGGTIAAELSASFATAQASASRSEAVKPGREKAAAAAKTGAAAKTPPPVKNGNGKNAAKSDPAAAVGKHGGGARNKAEPKPAPQAPAKDRPAGEPSELAVLGWSGTLRMEGVDARQVSWLNRPGFGTSGRMDLRAKAEAPKAPAAATAKLSQVVRRATAEVAANLGPCTLDWAADKAQPKAQARQMLFSSLQAQARFAPAPAGDADWAVQMDGGLTAVGTKPLLTLETKASGLLRSQQGKVQLTGAVASGKLKGWFLPKRENEASFSGRGNLDVSGQNVNLSWASLQAFGLNLSGAVSGSQMLSANYSLSGRIRCADGDPKRLLAALDIRIPKSSDKRALQHMSGEADLTLGAKGLSLVNIAAQVDDMPVRGSYAVQNYDAPKQTLALSGGNFDLDRYLPAPEIARRGAAQERPAPEPLPVDSLRELNLEGSVALRSFKFKGLTTRDFKAGLNARSGALLIKPLGGNFYGGTLSGEFSAQVAGNALQTRLALVAKDFQAGPFMVGWAGKQYVSGRADLFLDVTGAGATDTEVLRSLEGLGAAKISDGAYTLGAAAEQPQPAQSAPPGARRSGPSTNQAPAASTRQPGTTFAQASAKFRVQKGWFQTDDFRMDASQMLVTGKGRFSPAEDAISLNLSASMANMPDVPIRVFGRLKDPEMEIPTGTLIGNTIMSILGLPLKPIKFFKDLLF